MEGRRAVVAPLLARAPGPAEVGRDPDAVAVGVPARSAEGDGTVVIGQGFLVVPDQAALAVGQPAPEMQAAVVWGGGEETVEVEERGEPVRPSFALSASTVTMAASASTRKTITATRTANDATSLSRALIASYL